MVRILSTAISSTPRRFQKYFREKDSLQAEVKEGHSQLVMYEMFSKHLFKQSKPTGHKSLGFSMNSVFFF
jgi:hypothetical protein